MEENELLTEETTPMEEAESQEAEVDTEVDVTEEETAAEGEETTEEDAAEGETIVPESFSIRYKHEDMSLTMDEAKRLAQIGKHYEDSIKDTLDALDYVATLRGQSVKDFVDSIVSGVESGYREDLVSELGEDNPLVEELLELRRAKNQKSYSDAVAERTAREQQAEAEANKSKTDLLAEQFESLRELFPDLDTVEKVPDAVIKRALKSGDLEKEMLKYEIFERKKIEAAKASQEKNKNQNVGSVRTTEQEDSVSSAFLKGIWS